MPDRSMAAARLVGDPETNGDEKEELQLELDRRGAEILRLRDLLMVKDHELGAVKGQLAELENISRGMMMAAHRIQRRVPWALRLARILLRPLLGRRGGG